MQVCKDAPAVKLLKLDTKEGVASVLARSATTRKNKKLKMVNFMKKQSPLSPEKLEDTFAETDYVIDEKKGLRRVRPYYFTHHKFALKRWLGMSVFDMMMKEFSLHISTPEKLEQTAERGYMLFNMEKINANELKERIIKDGDMISTKDHRHEPPVRTQLPEVIADTEEFYVVNKPSSLPIHPVAQYRHNSLIFLLAREYKVNYHVIHRLDRLTSGLVIFAKTKDVAKRVSKEISDRVVKKQYLLRVVGKFPEKATCDESLFEISAKKGIYRVAKADDEAKKVKTALTEFELVEYFKETDESLVRAMPKTGRTHQIRVHTQYLGCPIVNDPVYNDPLFGKERFLETQQREDITEEMAVEGLTKTKDWGPKGYKICENDCMPEMDFEKDPLCDKCLNPPADPDQHDLILYLHAHKYSGANWSFETSTPFWAESDFKTPEYYKKYLL